MIGDADVLDQLMNKQARAATTIMNCVDPKGSLFVKYLLMTFFGRDGSAIITQVDRIQEVFGPYIYMTVVDFHQFSESVSTEYEIYNKLVCYYSRPHDHPKTEYDFMKDLLSKSPMIKRWQKNFSNRKETPK